jgi:hypothetical protein
MDIEVVRRICLARHLFELGNSSLKSSNDLYLFSAANLLQDSVEAFLLAVADFVGASIDSNAFFDKYFVLINKKIDPKELPFKNKLLRLNKIRINSKHYGIMPARDECIRLAVSVREFFEEVSASILKANFSTVSTIDLLKDGETKDLLHQARKHLEEKKYEDCAITCRKAIYLEILQDYNISEFLEKSAPRGLLGPFSNAPFYAKNKDYIQKNVKDPTDFIVLNHNHLDQELLKYSVDNTTFWNIWRLTPEVYKTNDNQWVVKYDFDKLENETLQDKIEYIFNSTVDIILSIHTKKENIKTRDYRNYFLELSQEEVPILEKADSTSKVVGTIPSGVTKVDCKYRITGLNGDGPYWMITHYKEKVFLYGFIHNDYVK